MREGLVERGVSEIGAAARKKICDVLLGHVHSLDLLHLRKLLLIIVSQFLTFTTALMLLVAKLHLRMFGESSQL